MQDMEIGTGSLQKKLHSDSVVLNCTKIKGQCFFFFLMLLLFKKYKNKTAVIDSFLVIHRNISEILHMLPSTTAKCQQPPRHYHHFHFLTMSLYINFFSSLFAVVADSMKNLQKQKL